MQCKLFVFDKPAQSWVERGRGLLRLNDMASTDDGTLQSRLGKTVPSHHGTRLHHPLMCFCLSGSDAYTGQPALDSEHKALASDAGGQSQREKRSDHSHGHRGPGRESLPHIGNGVTIYYYYFFNGLCWKCSLLTLLLFLRRALKMPVSWPRLFITGSWPCGAAWSRRPRAHRHQPNRRYRSRTRTTATTTSPLTVTAPAR